MSNLNRIVVIDGTACGPKAAARCGQRVTGFLGDKKGRVRKVVYGNAEQVKLLPLPELRGRLGELSPNDEIVIFCQTSIRAYQAQRILDGTSYKMLSSWTAA
jgi:hypothetical protein